MIAVIFLVFAVVSAQQRNEHYSSRIGDSLIASDGKSSRTHRQAIMYPRGKLYGLRTHRFSTAHFVNGSNMNGAYVKVYGEANPSRTDEHLLDIETQTRLLPVRSHIASSESSGGNGHELSISGYGPPGGEPEVPEAAGKDEQAEAATEMQEPLRPNVENPYDSIPAATEAEQQAITAEISSTSSTKEEIGVPAVTDAEQAIISSEATISATESREGLRETEQDKTESTLSATEVGSEASTEGSIAIETVAESSEVPVISSTSGVSTEQFESASIGTETVGISTTESVKIEDKGRIEGYGAGDESVRTEGISATEVQETPSESIESTPSESAAESSISDGITQTESTKMEIDAEDLGYGAPPQTLEKQPSIEKTPSSISQTLPELEATITSGAEETTYSATTLPTRYTETETTSFETEISTDQSILATAEVATELLTSPETSSPSTHIVTEEAEVITPPVIEPAGGVPGYETLSEPEISKEGLPGESSSQLEKPAEEATTLSEAAEETEITSKKAPEDMITEPEDLKDSAGLVTSSVEVSETTGFPKDASLPHAEQPSGYSEIAPEYTTGHAETTELQKISEGTEVPAETSPAEEKAVSDETPAISTEVFVVSGSVENGATELPSEPKEDKAASEITVPIEETEIPKSGEGLAGYGEILSTPESDTEAIEPQKLGGEATTTLESSERPSIAPTDFYETTLQTEFITEAGPGEQPSSIEILTESITDTEVPERTTQSSEEKTETGELTSILPEISPSESSIIETKFDSATTFNEQIITGETIASDETKGSDEQPVGYGEPLVVPHESTAEAEETESPLPEKTSDELVEETTAPLTSSKDFATFEAIVTTGEAAEETESASTIQTEHADTRISAEDFGYGGGAEEAVTEKEQIDETSITDKSVPKSDLESTTLGEEVLISSTAAGAEETTEITILSTELRESTESIAESTEQFTNGGAETNELSPSDEKLTVPLEIGKSTPEVSEIASATKGTVSLSSLESESAASIIVTSHAISEGTEYTEVPVSETASVQIESSKIPTDKHDFGYGEKIEEVTEEKLTAETAITEPMITTHEQIIVETTAESEQQPPVTETLSAESSITILSETIDSATESKTSLQYPEETTLLQTLSELPDVKDTATSPSMEGIETVGTSDAAESTLMHVITSEVEVPVPYGEEAPQVIAMTKIMKTGPSAITASETRTTEGVKEKEEGTGLELGTMREFEAETTKSEETTEVRSEVDTISSEATLMTSPEESVTATAEIAETESYAKSSEDISAKIPMGPADFGYGGEIEHISSMLPEIESVTTTISELPLSSEQQDNHIETSVTPESTVNTEYSSSEMLSESASKSSEKYATATLPSVPSEALTESATQTMLATHDESITSEDIHDQKDISSKIPTGPADFGYGDSVQEQSNVASHPRAYSDAIIASNKSIIFGNQERTRQKHFDGPVLSNTASAKKQLEKIDNSSRRKWKPFTIDCKKEVDEKGDLCQEWARAGLCATHRPTMFLFCRRTCLCIGPPMDLIR
ncbi:Uncharacterized protein ACO02O_10444 [Dirofilaria immitis]